MLPSLFVCRADRERGLAAPRTDDGRKKGAQIHFFSSGREKEETVIFLGFSPHVSKWVLIRGLNAKLSN